MYLLLMLAGAFLLAVGYDVVWNLDDYFTYKSDKANFLLSTYYGLVFAFLGGYALADGFRHLIDMRGSIF